ncbi:hypothetical protein ACFXOL_20985 [Streptomyces californicus]|uniref:hypothetical protein n=1 Tax=Streptomyces californicus TaxID=67351 RepID=UPI00365330EA
MGINEQPPTASDNPLILAQDGPTVSREEQERRAYFSVLVAQGLLSTLGQPAYDVEAAKYQTATQCEIIPCGSSDRDDADAEYPITLFRCYVFYDAQRVELGRIWEVINHSREYGEEPLQWVFLTEGEAKAAYASCVAVGGPRSDDPMPEDLHDLPLTVRAHVLKLGDEARSMRRAIEAVRELHERCESEAETGPYCGLCSNHGDTNWPCATGRALGWSSV